MPRVSTKEFAGTRAHYENKVMADFALGGRQTLALETLVAAIRKVGMQPVLYLMPVTSKHHSLYPGETWDRTLAHIASLAGEWDLPFVDLDRNHGLPLDVFHDTGHLQPAGAEIISTRLVDRVLAAALR